MDLIFKGKKDIQFISTTPFFFSFLKSQFHIKLDLNALTNVLIILEKMRSHEINLF